MQNGSVVAKERLVLNTNQIIIVASFPDTPSYKRHVISAPPIVASLN